MKLSKLRTLAVAVSVVAALGTGAAMAQSKAAPAKAAPAAAGGEQYFPVLSYRTGAYGPNGAQWADGYVDYLKLINAQGGINGVKIAFEECEFGYDTARGVECYERLKSKGTPGPALFQPLSTGVTFAVTDKTATDKIPLVTVGYGRADAVEGEAFP
jgi:branched-chain amino acid transport system substrate-binding protein